MLSYARDKFPKPLILLILLASILVIFGAVFFYRSQKSKILSTIYYELDLVTSLKTEEIRKWRLEHVRDAYIISNFIHATRLTHLLLSSKNNDEKIKDEIGERLEMFIQNYDYHSVILLDSAGNIRLAYPPYTSGLKQIPVSDFNMTDIHFSDLHFSEDMPGMHLDLSIPIFENNAAQSSTIGLILFRIDPSIHLFPTIQTWQVPMKSAEILLIKPDGDSVTYLNNTRASHGSGQFSRPMTMKSLPAVQAVTGHNGRFEGIDYMNVPVLSFIRKIPNTSWTIIAKVDKKEALTVLYQQTIMVSIIVFLLIVFFITFTFYIWRSQNSQFYKQLSFTKDRFVSIITHDLTNPFVSIVGFCDMLIGNIKKQDYRNAEKFAGIIHDSSISALNLLRNLVQWSRLQTNKIRTQLSDVNLIEVIEEAAEFMKAFADRKNIEIRKNTPYEIRTCADREMMSTVVRNLIANAIKYSLPGGKVDVIAYRDNDGIVVEIQDYGVGIDPARLGEIFSAEGISLPGTMAETGTGLGLSLCRDFVMKHGGKIWAQSEINKGSRFKFTIPDLRKP